MTRAVRFSPFDWPVAHFAHIDRQHRRNMDRLLTPYGIKHRDWRVMVFIDEAGVVGVTQLADQTVIERSTIGKLLARLKTRGLVTDAKATDDARVNPVRLTARGRGLLAQTTPLIEMLFVQYRSDMSDAEHLRLMQLTARYRQQVFKKGAELSGRALDEHDSAEEGESPADPE